MTERALPLSGRTALVTGVSRRQGIGFAIAKRFVEDGASVFIAHYSPHDEQQPWGGDDFEALRKELAESLTDGAAFGELSVDLAEPDAPSALIEQARTLTGSLDILVCNHAMSGSDGSILDVDSGMLDRHFFTNTRSAVLLTKLFAQTFSGAATGPAVVPGDVLTGSQGVAGSNPVIPTTRKTPPIQGTRGLELAGFRMFVAFLWR
ncbi:SDR family oxidoreductase [Acaricomes phytoseiuli]|uniref:SDR family oxidoreductase n=1 Tax=Acaricomes phytoseiuli TaxID=291968 RepID=UPI0003737EA2|nr:SDR family oxidoreductase [Acaricomes phytoseiuli]